MLFGRGHQLKDRQQAEERAAYLNGCALVAERSDVFHPALHDVVRGKWGVVRYKMYPDKTALGYINQGFVWFEEGRPTRISWLPE